MTVEFSIEGQRFIALNGGPLFKFTPTVSFLVACSTIREVDRLWERLSERASALMELGRYPFSERYGWTQDRDKEKVERVTNAFLAMKKFDIGALERAYAAFSPLSIP